METLQSIWVIVALDFLPLLMQRYQKIRQQLILVTQV